ncbi:MAG TPA: metal-dependent hydrolase [Candidatus Babeliales bacterium]|nr:metal-dependent hydrolase [Candidatus Babeliales bacterium]
MPNYKIHLLGGMISYLSLLLLIGYNQSISVLVSWAAMALIGSLFPDVDTSSKIQKIFYRFVFGCLLLALWYKYIIFFIILSLLSFLPFLVSHRGLFHRFWFITFFSGFIIISIITLYPHLDKMFIIYPLLFFLIGALSHLILDLGPRAFKI